MKKSRWAWLILCAGMWVSLNSLSWAAVDLIAQGSIASDAVDDSGLTGDLEDGTPQNRMGGFGSAIAYTGVNRRYLCVADRGPADGKTKYNNRFYEFDISIVGGEVHPALVATRLLKKESGE